VQTSKFGHFCIAYFHSIHRFSSEIREQSNVTLRDFTLLPRIVIDFFLSNQPDALIIPILFCYKTLHVSGIFSAYHQEFSTVLRSILTLLGSGHQKHA